MTVRRKRPLGPGFLIAACCAALAGCFGPQTFNNNNKLTDTARAVRDASAPPPGYPRELDKSPAEPYVVEPGDVLLVQPSNLDSPLRLPGDQPVLPDGTIQLGRFGRLPVAGKTLEVIEADVNALVKSREKEDEKNGNGGPILVRLVTRDSKVFYVLGEVNAPGAFPLRGRETVLDAIVAAGGLNTNASRKTIVLSRPTAPDSCRAVLPVDYNGIVQLGDTTTNYQIRAGDRVYVPGRTLHEQVRGMFGLDKDGAGCGAVPCFPGGATLATPAPLAVEVPRLDLPARAPAAIGAPVVRQGTVEWQGLPRGE